jgi:hypothetical protein
MKETTNMARTNRLPLLVLFFATMSLALSSVFSTTAQSEQEKIQIGFSPIVIEFSANPGETVENNIRIDNSSDEAIVLETIPKNLTPRGEEGQVDLTEDDTSYSLADWITVSPAQTPIEAKSSFDFKATITLPENAEPGGHFGAIVFKTIPPDPGTGNAAVSQEVAPLILVSVAGDVVEEANIASFKSTKSLWTTERPIQFETRIENTGTVHFKPKGTVTVKNMFGDEVAKLNLDEKNVLPESIRRIVTDWDPGFSVGRYTADLTVVYGEENKILTSSTTFIVFPYQTIIPAVLITVGLVYVVIRFRKRIGLALKVLSGKN